MKQRSPLKLQTMACGMVMAFFLISQLRASTNLFFDIRMGINVDTNGQPAPLAYQIIETQRDVYSRPEEEDPQGNWGFIGEGCRLSLRFPKDTFAPGEAVPGFTIVRNVSQEPKLYSVSSISPKVIVLNASGEQLQTFAEKRAETTFQRRLRAG